MSDGAASTADRRPVSARRWGLLRAAAGTLARRHVSPNAVSTAGMVCGVGAGAAFAAASHVPTARLVWLAGVALIGLRASANVLDGLVAVEFGRGDPVGVLYNEVPDRISDAAMLIGLGYAPGGNVELGYVAACLALLTAYVRVTGKSAGASQEYGGPMAKQQRMAVAALAALYAAFVPPPIWLVPNAGAARVVLWVALYPASAGLALIAAGSAWTVVRRLQRIAANLRQVGKPA